MPFVDNARTAIEWKSPVSCNMNLVSSACFSIDSTYSILAPAFVLGSFISYSRVSWMPPFHYCLFPGHHAVLLQGMRQRSQNPYSHRKVPPRTLAYGCQGCSQRSHIVHLSAPLFRGRSSHRKARLRVMPPQVRVIWPRLYIRFLS